MMVQRRAIVSEKYVGARVRTSATLSSKVHLVKVFGSSFDLKPAARTLQRLVHHRTLHHYRSKCSFHPLHLEQRTFGVDC